MPKESVYRLECDRCGKQWFPKASEGEPATPSLKLELFDAKGQVLDAAHFEVLCEDCATTLAHYVANITKDLKRPRRAKKKGEGDEPPPTRRESVPPKGRTRDGQGQSAGGLSAAGTASGAPQA